jgi:nucleotide-binding universal stress UspA family protein
VILLCYDGSSDAQSAIDHAGELLGDRTATILTVWEPFVDVLARAGLSGGLGAAAVDIDGIDAATEQAARARAQEGAERARGVGLDPQPRTSPRDGTIAHTILAEAKEVGADTIVLGTRGLTGLKSVLLGSVSHAVLQHADRTVVVVPSPEVAAERAASSG